MTPMFGSGRREIALILCIGIASTCLASDKQVSYGATYSGGSLPTVKTGEGVRLFLYPDQIWLVRRHDTTATLIVKTASVTEISYGQEVHRRVGTAMGVGLLTLGVGTLLVFSHSKKHYVGIVWDAGEDKKGGIVLQADKNEYRGVIAALEGITGKRAVNADSSQKQIVVE